MRLAVLMTCHNRKESTIVCLEALFNNELPVNLNIDVFLVDDGSKDGTTEAVKLYFSEVNIIEGTGNLFWNQGMRLAWQTAAKTKEYDFYLWLNDDTNLDNDALDHIFTCYNDSLLSNEKLNIIVGACRNNVNNNNFSYGLRDEYGPIIPDGKFQYGKYINGNCVLVPAEIVDRMGILSDDYTHAMGDFDYGLSALRNGYNLATTKTYVATCPNNIGIPNWCNPKVKLIERWKHFHSPLGLNINEYKIFVKKNWPNNSFQYILKAYVKCLIPTVYNKLSNYAE